MYLSHCVLIFSFVDVNVVVVKFSVQNSIVYFFHSILELIFSLNAYLSSYKTKIDKTKWTKHKL